jgi:hypothetical protein
MVAMFAAFQQQMQQYQQPPQIVIQLAAPAPAIIRHKIALPEKFTGKVDKCRGFVAANENYFAMNLMNNEQKVCFMLQLLEEAASNWRDTQYDAIVDGPPWATNWDLFKQHFLERFQDKDKRHKAVNLIINGQLCQTTSAQVFIEKVEEVCYKAGYNSDQQKMDIIKNGLKLPVKQLMFGQWPHQWRDFVNTIVSVDEDLQCNKGNKQRTSQKKTTTTTTSASSSTSTYKPPPRMTSEEKDCHIKEGLCFYCHEKGHSALKCPKKNKGTTAKVAAIVTQEEPRRQEAQVAKMWQNDQR